jgi:predicted Zn-dependent peptidase
MTEIDPDRLAAQVRALHFYGLDPAGAARAARAIAEIAVADAALAAEPQFHEEPASLALTLSALAPEGE